MFPLYYNNEATYKKIKICDIVTFKNQHNKTIDVVITSIVCSSGETPNLLDVILNQGFSDDLPDVKSKVEAKKKYTLWYGEDALNDGAMCIKWELMDRTIEWD